jgi:site-specific DNA-methyltransferase (adenine-specific)
MTAAWQVIHGDCLEVLPTLGQVDHVITDPPYSEHVHNLQRRMLRGSGGRAAADGAKRGEVGFAPLGFEALPDETRTACAAHFARLVRRWCLVFSDQESQTLWVDDLVIAGMRHIRCGAWMKLCGQPQLSGDRPAVGHEAIEIAHAKGRTRWNGGGLPAVWAYAIATDRNGTGDRVHTTQKPVDLMLRLVEQFTDPGDLVLDPFCGSGTTGVACLRLGRRFIGIEKDAKYAAIARERLEAEARGLTLRDARAGQTSIFDAMGDS